MSPTTAASQLSLSVPDTRPTLADALDEIRWLDNTLEETDTAGGRAEQALALVDDVTSRMPHGADRALIEWAARDVEELRVELAKRVRELRERMERVAVQHAA